MKTFPATRVLVGLLACPAAAHAQADNLQPRTDVSVSIIDQYDSNVLKGGFVQNVRPNAKSGDFVISPTLNLDMVSAIGQHRAFLRGLVGYNIHKRNTYLDREQVSLDGGIRVQASLGCQATVSGTISRQQIDLLDLNAGIDPRNTEDLGSAGVNLDCFSPAGLAGGVGYRRSASKNSAIIQKLTNSVVDSVDANIGLNNNLIGRIALTASYTNARYPRRIDPLTGLNDGFKSYNVGVRVTRDLGTQLRGTIGAGFTRVRPQNSFTPGFKGGTYYAQIDYNSFSGFHLGLNLAREVEQPNQFGANYGVTKSIGIDASYPLNRNLLIGATALRQDRSYRPTFAFVPINFLSGDRLDQIGGRITLKDDGPIALTASINHFRRYKTLDIYRYKSTQAGLTVTYRISGRGL